MNYLISAETETTNKITKTRPIKILQIVGGMHPGGIETNLMDVLNNIDRDLFQMDFMVHTLEPCEYDDEIRSLGSRIFASPYRPHPNRHMWTYPAFFRQVLKDYGPYDVVHSHCGYVDGNTLRIARQAGIPVRIAHAHNDLSHLRTQQPWKRQLYWALLKFWISRHATCGLAVSRAAAADMFGSLWESEGRCQILYSGHDLKRFQEQVEPALVRAELGIPTDAFVIGHIGRFELQKNHRFLIEIAAEIAKQEPNMRLLLVGTGSLRSEIEEQVDRLGLTDRVIFAGVFPRTDIPRILLGAIDVFLLPSLEEGLPQVLIQAQAAGLPCVFSDVITKETDVVKPLMNRLSLSQSVSDWAEIILAQQKANLPIEQSKALSILQNDSPFNIEISAKNLTEFYSEQLARTKSP